MAILFSGNSLIVSEPIKTAHSHSVINHRCKFKARKFEDAEKR